MVYPSNVEEQSQRKIPKYYVKLWVEDDVPSLRDGATFKITEKMYNALINILKLNEEAIPFDR